MVAELSLKNRTWHSTPTHCRTVSTIRSFAIDLTGELGRCCPALQRDDGDFRTKRKHLMGQLAAGKFNHFNDGSGEFLLHAGGGFHRHS